MWPILLSLSADGAAASTETAPTTSDIAPSIATATRERAILRGLASVRDIPSPSLLDQVSRCTLAVPANLDGCLLKTTSPGRVPGRAGGSPGRSSRWPACP